MTMDASFMAASLGAWDAKHPFQSMDAMPV
jgi:hypothetical protein